MFKSEIVIVIPTVGRYRIFRQSLGSRQTEVFCNAVAAEYLTPKELFLKEWVTHIDLGENMDHMVSTFRVSRWVIARRALDLKLIAQEAHDAFISSINEKNPSTGRGDYARSQKVRISERLAVAVATQALEGKILLREAQQLTGIRPNKLYAFAQKELGL